MDQLNLFAMHGSNDTFSDICAKLGCENNVPAWPDDFARSIAAFLRENNIPRIRTLSLFSGAGGLDIGFNDVGFDIIESVEIEQKFCQTLKLNSGEGKRFDHSKVNCIDIREFTGDHLEKIDFIIGGPPCQTFSAAGRRANGVLGTTDARGVLFREYVRLLQKLSPVGFFFENVYGIIGAQGGEAWKEILESFSEAGYKLYYRIVDAADYGVPQHRERLIIVGLKDGEFKFPRPTHGPDSLDDEPFYNAETAITGVELSEDESKAGIGGRYGSLLNDIPPGLNYSFYTEEMGHPNPVFAWRSKFSDFLYKADPNTPVRTIKASGGAYTGPFHWNNRFFAYPEYKRLQTFPDDYEISGTKQTAVKQIGNSVPPQLARMMALAIRQQVFNTKFPFTLSLLDDSEELTFRKRKRRLTAVYQKKAKMAIEAVKENHVVLPDSHKYYCVMSDNFKFMEVKKSEAEFEVDVVWGDILDILVKPLKNALEDPVIVIDIIPNGTSWNLDVSRVRLRAYVDQIKAFTVAWKAFNHELIINSIKADIIQLNGYYQYVPKLKCECKLLADIKYGDILSKVVAGELVTELVPSERLSKCWNIPEDELIDAARFLRKLGYEIRNHGTNPQIDEGDWLIPYAFPTLTPQSVQLRKKVIDMANKKNIDDCHLDVYLDRYEFHQNDVVTTYYEGFQNTAAQQRYEKINTALSNGYLYDVMKKLPDVDFAELSEDNKVLLRQLVNGITSEAGRALAGVAFLQLTIKSITPDQSIRLHKGTTRRGSFSWVDGISMRTIDSTYSTPFLREQGLLNVNKYGVFMTRSLAENYPYSKLYKAEMRGPFTEWIDIVDAIEDESMPAELGLYYLMAQLKNKSDAFNNMADEAVGLAKKYPDKTFEGISKFMKEFFNNTDYSARAFEIVIHGFMQAMDESHLLGDLDLVPMSQMRSANKKHGNIGDVELKDGRVIVEAWDAKYGKPYLRDELEELRDKILTSPGIKTAGFIVDGAVDRRKDVINRAEEIALETGVEIQLFSFDEWVSYQTKRIAKPELDKAAARWLIAVVESFAQRRLEKAPIDEPCEAWVRDLIKKLK